MKDVIPPKANEMKNGRKFVIQEKNSEKFIFKVEKDSITREKKESYL